MKIQIKESENVKIKLSSDTIPIKVPGGELDHNILLNRDLTDQHPIKSITDLNKQLNAKLNTNDAMTNAEIQQILGW